MNEDGSSPRRLTRGCCASWSPDGRRIAFDNEGVFVIEIDGSGLTSVRPGGSENRPDWSRDGMRLTFDDTTGVFTAKPDGSDLTRIAESASAPRWSPDRRRIAFERYVTEGGRFGDDIFIIDADGSDERRLTRGLGHSSPAWSPGGRKIAFQGYVASYDIFVIGADGSNQLRLTSTGSWEGPPVWSPRGQTLAFSAGTAGLYTIRADRRRYRRLAKRASEPSWSPDGKSIAFTRPRDGSGRSDIWTMTASGKNQVNLTDSDRTIHNAAPAWSPIGG